MPQFRRDFLKNMATGAAIALPAVTRGEERSRIKIAQIGVGHGHANKMAVYRQSADYEVVGIAEEDQALRKVAENLPAFKGLNWLPTEKLLATPGLQAVLVETRVADLLRTAAVCLKAGLHIHLDKAAGASLSEFKKILQLAGEQKRLVQLGYMFRYNPAIRLLREFLQNGWLGDIHEVHTVIGKVVDPASRAELAKFPGGIMFELGCHVLDLVITLMGRPAKVTSFARHSSPLPDKLADSMLAVLEYPRAIASIRASAVEVDGTERRHLVVCGTEGTFHIQPLDNPSARVTLNRPRGTYVAGYQDIRFPKFQRYAGDAADMAKIIRGEKRTDYSPEHDLLVQETLFACCGVAPG